MATSRYTDGALNQLRAPARDANQLGAVLADPAIGGFAVTKVLNRTAHKVRLATETFLRNLVPEDLVVVYLTCHGVTDKRRRLYFAAVDTRKDLLAATGVESQWLIDQLDECRARSQVLILDCCFSGAFARGAKGPDDLSLGERFHGHGRGRAVLTASRGTEYSYEGQPIPGQVQTGSVFTSALVHGIRTGEADTDQDGYISVDDAFLYAFDRMQDGDAAQTPQRWLYGTEGKILLARSPAGITVQASTLPPAWSDVLNSPHPEIRVSAVAALEEWLKGSDPAKSLAARTALEQVVRNDVTRVAEAARALLESDTALAAGASASTAETAEPMASPLTEIGSTPQPAQAVGSSASAPSSRAKPTPKKPANADGKRPPTPGTYATTAVPPRGAAGRPGRIRYALSVLAAGLLVALTVGLVEGIIPDFWSSNTPSSPRTAHTDQISDVAFSPNGKTLASASRDKSVRLWDPATGKPRKTFTYSQWVSTIAYSPTGTRLAVGGYDGNVILQRPDTKSAELVLGGHLSWVGGISFDSTSPMLATGSFDRKVRIWDSRNGNLLRALSGHKDAVPDTAFSPDGSILASASGDRTIRLWNPDTGELLRTLTGHTGWITEIAFRPDGEMLASASQDRTVRLWNPETGQLLRTLKNPNEAFNAVDFSPDSNTLATGSGNHNNPLSTPKAEPGDNEVRLWDPATGAVLRTLTGHTGAVSTVAFSPNGKKLASGSEDKSIRLWDPATGKLLHGPL